MRGKQIEQEIKRFKYQHRASGFMTTYGTLLKKDEFLESLGRATRLIDSGMKAGLDNLDLYLDRRDAAMLGPLVEILNKCELEDRLGKPKKSRSLKSMLDHHDSGWEKGLGRIFNKCKELENIGGWYMDAEGWLRILNFGRYSEATPPTDEEIFVEAVKYFAGLKDDNKMPETIYAAHFGDDPADCVPPSNTDARNFYSNKEINDLHTSLDKSIVKLNVKEDYKNDLMKLKKISADKYAYTRAELLNMLELYNEYQA